MFVGELRELKGVAILCSAIELLRAEFPVRLLITGSGPDEDTLRSWVQDRGLEKSIVFAPPVRRAAEAFSAGRCVVVPSLAESFPYVVLEAAAAARPMVATKVGGIPEIVGPWADQLVPPGDVLALAARLRQFLADPAAAEADASLLACHIQSRYTVEAMAASVGHFYRCVTTNGQRPWPALTSM